MTDFIPNKPVAADPTSANDQKTVSLAIVSAMTVIAGGALAVALLDKSLAGEALAICTGVIGSLATALNAPSGIGNVIAQAKKPTDTP